MTTQWVPRLVFDWSTGEQKEQTLCFYFWTNMQIPELVWIQVYRSFNLFSFRSWCEVWLQFDFRKNNLKIKMLHRIQGRSFSVLNNVTFRWAVGGRRAESHFRVVRKFQSPPSRSLSFPHWRVQIGFWGFEAPEGQRLGLSHPGGAVVSAGSLGRAPLSCKGSRKASW